MTSPFKKRVILVEDDQEIRNSFSLIVNSSPKFTVVNGYGDGEEAIKNLNKDKRHLLEIIAKFQMYKTISEIDDN